MRSPAFDKFKGDLLESRLVTADQIADAEKLLNEMTGSGDDDALRLARALVKKGHLTSYQAERVLMGRTVGFFFGRYKILDSIGRGSMGKVYKAQDTVLDRRVALKILPRQLASTPKLVARFRQEGAASARLNHPNIVQAYDLGEQNDLHYIALEYVSGHDLKYVIRRKGRLSPRLAIHLGLQVAAGLEHAAQQGVVHRDLKPSNILVDRNWHAKILDMGLARLADDGAQSDIKARITKAGEVLGTFDYIAPEQSIDTREADGRSDIYSLGCTIYHMLAGHPPFPEGTGIVKLQKHQSEEPQPLEELVSDLPPGLGDVVRHMMAKDPDERYQTPTEVIAALKEVRSGAERLSVKVRTDAGEGSGMGPGGSWVMPGLGSGSDPALSSTNEAEPTLKAPGSSEEMLAGGRGVHGSSTHLPEPGRAGVNPRLVIGAVGLFLFLALLVVAWALS